MRHIYLFALLLLSAFSVKAQILDTLAIQDFEITPMTPTWTFTGPVIYNSGFSSASAAPPNSPLGIGGSRAWETTVNSAGLVLDFANVAIPSGYDSVRVHFNLAGMNLNGSTGGPDNLDYVLVAVSLDGGTTFYNRLRIRGAATDNGFFAYSATGVAKVYYQPQTETMFQSANSGLATTDGYSNCEIVFPGTVTQVQIRMTGRSSSSSDTWLVDNLLITGESACGATSTVNAAICSGDSYTLPGGSVVTAAGTYMDTLSGGGCDTVITTNLSVLSTSSSSNTVAMCDGGTYTLPGGAVVTVGGTYMDTLVAANSCDSVITTFLTVHPTYEDTVIVDICQGQTYQLPGGGVVSTSGFYEDTLATSMACDSVIVTFVNVIAPSNLVIQSGNTLTADQFGATYQWLDCNAGFAPVPGATGQTFTSTVNGSFAVALNLNGCLDTSACHTVTPVGLAQPFSALEIAPNPFRDMLVVKGINGAVLPAVRLYDLQGRVQAIGVQANGAELRIATTGLAEGVYFLSVEGVGTWRVMRAGAE